MVVRKTVAACCAQREGGHKVAEGRKGRKGGRKGGRNGGRDGWAYLLVVNVVVNVAQVPHRDVRGQLGVLVPELEKKG